jgi:metallo-beta-lactamase class B
MLSRIHHCFSIALVLCSFLGIAGCVTKTDPAPVSGSPKKWVNTCADWDDWDDWDKPGPPFRIFGNSYYVGACGIAAILVTGDDGHILIDGGTEVGASVIAKNIKDLGFSLNDVKILLHSHEHFDHVAGLAKLQKLSGARLLASPEAAPVLSTGIATDIDPQAGMHKPFPASQVGGIVRSGEAVNLGNLTLTPVATPGHTPGALSWQWRSCQNNRCFFVVYADSLSPISSDNYHFSDHPGYVDAYQAGLQTLANLDCQILVTPHPSASNMRDRLSTPEGLIDPKGCMVYADNVSKRLEKRLIREQDQ